jgi:hypothetical protein
MKKTGFLCILAAVAVSVFLEVQLSQTRAQLAQAQESLRQLRLVQGTSGPATAEPAAQESTDTKVAALETKIKAQQKTIESAKLELRLFAARLKEADSKPLLEKGSYSLGDGTVVYAPDAQVRLKNGALVSSPTGVMVSDASLDHVVGDLVVDYNGTRFSTSNAFVSFEDGHMHIVSEVMESKNK